MLEPLARDRMPLVNRMKAFLDRRELRFAFVPLISHLARCHGKGVQKVFYDEGVWIHRTSRGYFAYHQPFVRLDMAYLDRSARTHFFWGYSPKPGDVVLDIGAGVGEEALTFSRAVGDSGTVICIEAHPRTYRCLKKLVQYNRLANVIPLYMAVTDQPSGTVTIEDSETYLSNRVNAGPGFRVPATTVDAVCRRFGLSRIHFLKMNIEGAERLAISGMTETLRQTEVICISCHDFLADLTGDATLRTKNVVRQFFQDSGFDTVERSYPGLPPYLRDQVWAYNHRLLDLDATLNESAATGVS